MPAARIDRPAPPASDAPAHAAWLADRALAAAIEAVHPRAAPAALRRAARAALADSGGDPLPLRVTIRSAARPCSTPLEPGMLIAIQVSGQGAGHPFRAARTTVVGYDTLPEQVRLGRAALRALSAGIEALRPGQGTAAFGRAARSALADEVAGIACRLRCDLLLPRPSDTRSTRSGSGMARADGERGDRSMRARAGAQASRSRKLSPGDTVAVSVVLAQGGQCIVLADMLRLSAEPSGPAEALTRLSHRLWL